MAEGIELARADNPAHAAQMELMKEQMIIVLALRLAGVGINIDVPTEEINATGGYLMTMRMDPEINVFQFTVIKKH